MVEGAGFEPAKHEAADLQSAGFDRSPTPPKNSGQFSNRSNFLSTLFNSFVNLNLKMNTKLQHLDQEFILKSISLENSYKLLDIKVLQSTKSTNDDAKDIFPEITRNGFCYCFIAEEQTSGRGTKGKKWLSPYGKNIYLSLAWKESLPLHETEGLSLAVAVAITKTLNQKLDLEIKIKWPNDLILEGKKLGGILIETSVAQSTTDIVIGLGLNVLMQKSDINKIDKEWTSILYHTNKILDRNKISGLLLNSLLDLTTKFKNYGFKYYKDSFEELNFLKGKNCQVTTEKESNFKGKAYGVTDKGELLIVSDQKNLKLRSGTNSILILD